MTQPLLVIKRQINAPPAAVFSAWSKPELLREWIFPFQNWKADGKNVFKVGGEYSVEFTSMDGSVYSHSGKYVEIIQNAKIVFTWNTSDMTDTLITVDLHGVNGNTEVTLTHEQFPNEEVRNRYHEGWQNCLTHLEEFLKSQKTNQLKA